MKEYISRMYALPTPVSLPSAVLCQVSSADILGEWRILMQSLDKLHEEHKEKRAQYRKQRELLLS